MLWSEGRTCLQETAIHHYLAVDIALFSFSFSSFHGVVGLSAESGCIEAVTFYTLLKCKGNQSCRSKKKRGFCSGHTSWRRPFIMSYLPLATSGAICLYPITCSLWTCVSLCLCASVWWKEKERSCLCVYVCMWDVVSSHLVIGTERNGGKSVLKSRPLEGEAIGGWESFCYFYRLLRHK